MAAWFTGIPLVPLPKPGTRLERDKARLEAARLVTRNGGHADDLKLVLDSLDLWPAQDPQ